MGARIAAAPSQARWARILTAAVLPLAIAALAFLLWWISDRLVHIGPLDRAAFGWIIVMPTWIAAPVVAGWAWRGLDPRLTLAVASFVGVVIAAVAAALMWQAVAFPACETGAIHAPQEMVAPSLLFGTVVGGGLAVSGLVTASLARQRRPVAALVLGAGSEVLMVGAALVVAALTLLGPACQRPTV